MRNMPAQGLAVDRRQKACVDMFEVLAGRDCRLLTRPRSILGVAWPGVSMRGSADAQTSQTAITRWLSHKTQMPVPGWAQRAKRFIHPVFLAEKLYLVGDRMKGLIRRETPPEMAELNVWIRERDLATL